MSNIILVINGMMDKGVSKVKLAILKINHKLIANKQTFSAKIQLSTEIFEARGRER